MKTQSHLIETFNVLHNALHVVQHRPVTLQNGTRSNYYIDARLISMSPLARSIVTSIFHRHIPYDLSTLCIGGPATAAIPLVTALSTELHIPSFYVRKEAKSYGLEKQIEGYVSERAILVDDTLHSGDSLIHCAKILRDRGTQIQQALVIYDRRNKEATKKLNDANLEVFAIKEIKINETEFYGYMPPTAEHGMHLI